MQLIGQLKAEGRTQEELAALIKEKLKASVYESEPEVTVQVSEEHSKKFYI